MDKVLEFFDTWAKTQKEFLETSLKSQEVFRSNWLDSMKKTQESFLTTSSSYDNPQAKEMLNLFNNWFTTMINSSQLFNDEIVKIQKSWEKTLETQIDQSKELVKGFTVFLKQPESK
jgi:hypothetical protein